MGRAVAPSGKKKGWAPRACLAWSGVAELSSLLGPVAEACLAWRAGSIVAPYGNAARRGCGMQEEGIGPKAVVRKLNGRTFRSYSGMEDAVRKLFKRHRQEFPVEYSHVQLMEWANGNGWILLAGRSGFRIVVTVPLGTA